MRRMLALVAFFVCLTACSPPQRENENIIKEYYKFLDGDISVEGVDMNYITIPKGELDKQYSTQYAFWDSNGDDILELHIKSSRYYYILTYKNDKLMIWKNLSPYPYYIPLKNGAFMCWNPGGAPMSDAYTYIIFDVSGNEIFKLDFSKYDSNLNNSYDENDSYYFNEVLVTRELWDSLTRQYLFVDENNIEKIYNEIEWTDFLK